MLYNFPKEHSLGILLSMKKMKKPVFIALISLDVALTVFLFVLSIIMLATMPEAQTLTIWRNAGYDGKGMIEYLQVHSTLYLFVGVIPLFLLLTANIVALVIYVKKSGEKKKVQLNELTDEQKEALRQELLKDLDKGSDKAAE